VHAQCQGAFTHFQVVKVDAVSLYRTGCQIWHGPPGLVLFSLWWLSGGR